MALAAMPAGATVTPTRNASTAVNAAVTAGVPLTPQGQFLLAIRPSGNPVATADAATVRGTIWLTQDRCDGTLTRVKRGIVSVRDVKRGRTVSVKAGHSYLARATGTARSRSK